MGTSVSRFPAASPAPSAWAVHEANRREAAAWTVDVCRDRIRELEGEVARQREELDDLHARLAIREAEAVGISIDVETLDAQVPVVTKTEGEP